MTLLRSTRLHIAFVITNLGDSGASRILLQTAEGLIGLGHRVDIVLLRPGIRHHQEIPAAARLVLSESASDALEADEESRIPASVCRWHMEKVGKVLLKDAGRLLQALNWHPLSLPTAGMFKSALFVADYVRKETPDCVLPALPNGNVVATLIVKSLLNYLPIVIPVVHSMLENRRLRDRIRYSTLMAHSDHIVAVSEGVRHNVSVKAGLPKERITTIYNPVVTPRLAELSREIPPHPWLTGGGSTHHPFRRQVRTGQGFSNVDPGLPKTVDSTTRPVDPAGRRQRTEKPDRPRPRVGPGG